MARTAPSDSRRLPGSAASAGVLAAFAALATLAVLALLLLPGCGARTLPPGTSDDPPGETGQGTFGLMGRLRVAYLEGLACNGGCSLARPMVPGLAQRLGVVQAAGTAMPVRLRLASSDPAVLEAPGDMMDETALRDFAVSSVGVGRAELRFYTPEGELYDLVELSVERPARLALQLGPDDGAIDELERLELRVGETLRVQPVALSQGGEVMQAGAFSLVVADPEVAGFAAFAAGGLGGPAYVDSRMQSGTLVARAPGSTVLTTTTAGVYREVPVVVLP
jgi:hypothetical protein